MSDKGSPKPWDIEPSLTEERLRLLAEFLMTIGMECFLLHDTKAGDGGWALGCRTFQRVCNRLIEKSASQAWPWLRARRQRSDLEFSLMVGSVLLRYFRGDADNPNQIQLIRAEENLKAFGFLMDDPDNAFSWFIIVERDPAGRPLRVVVEQANSNGETRYPWVAAIAKTEPATATKVTPLEKPPVDPGPPEITAIPSGGKKSGSQNE
jgi:hypothetical protein